MAGKHRPDAGGRESYEPSIPKGVVQHGLCLELQGIWRTNDVDDRDMLGEGWQVYDGLGEYNN